MTRSMKALEGVPLAVSVVAPDGQVVGLAALDRDEAEEVLEPEAELVLDRPRVGLDVEEDVERRWLGQSGEALVGLLGVGLDQLVEQLVGILALRPGCAPARADASACAG